MEIEDAYKWLYHATLGGDHAVQDESGPRTWLESEWKSLGPPAGKEPRVVRLTPDGSVLRVNLRPYSASGGDREMLLAIFVSSARSFHPVRDRFVEAWISLGHRLRSRSINRLTYARWRALDKQTRKRGYPAIEHSESYIEAYRPAYRVVLGSLWE